MEVVVSGGLQQRSLLHELDLQVVVHVVEAGTRFRGRIVPLNLRWFHMFIAFCPVRLLLQPRILFRCNFRVQFRGHRFSSFGRNRRGRLGRELLTRAVLRCSILLVLGHFCMRHVFLLLPFGPTILELENEKKRVMAVKYAKNNFSTLKLTQILTCWDEKSRKQKVLIVCESLAGRKFVIKSL